MALTKYEDVYYNDGYFCDMCATAFERGHPEFERMYHCTYGCQYDLCHVCHSRLARRQTLRSNKRRQARPGS